MTEVKSDSSSAKETKLKRKKTTSSKMCILYCIDMGHILKASLSGSQTPAKISQLIASFVCS